MPNLLRPGVGLLGGVPGLYFVEYGLITMWPAADGVMLGGPVELLPGTAWTKLEGLLYTASLETKLEASVAGNAHPHELTGFYTGEGPEVATQMHRMQGRRFAVLVSDPTGAVRLIGDRLGGLKFTAEYRTGDKPGTRRGWLWSFKEKLSTPARYYSEPFEVEELGVQTPGTSTGGGGDSGGSGGSTTPVLQLTITYAVAVQLASLNRFTPGQTYRITSRPYGRPDVIARAADSAQLEEAAAQFTNGIPEGGRYTLQPDGFILDETITFVVSITYNDISSLAGDEQLAAGQLYHVYARPTSAAHVLVRAATSYSLYSGDEDAQLLPVPTALNPLPEPIPGKYVLSTDHFTAASFAHPQNTDLGTTLRSFIIQLQSQNQDQGEQVTVLGFGTSQVGTIGAMGLRWQDADSNPVFEWVQTTDYQEDGATTWTAFAAGAGTFAELDGDPRANAALDTIISLLEDALAARLNLSGGTVTGDIVHSGAPGTNAARLITYAEAVALLGLASANSLCYVTTTANHSLSGLANVPQNSGSVAITAGARVAVLFQTAPAQNGIYVAAAGAWSRAADANTALSLSQVLVQVEKGTYANRLLASEFDSASTLGTDPVTFNVIGAVGTYLAGTGLQLTSGSTFSLIYASAAELATGTDTAKVVNSATLATEFTRRLPAPAAPVPSVGGVLTLNIGGANYPLIHTSIPSGYSSNVTIALSGESTRQANMQATITIENKSALARTVNLPADVVGPPAVRHRAMGTGKAISVPVGKILTLTLLWNGADYLWYVSLE